MALDSRGVAGVSGGDSGMALVDGTGNEVLMEGQMVVIMNGESVGLRWRRKGVSCACTLVEGGKE